MFVYIVLFHGSLELNGVKELKPFLLTKEQTHTHTHTHNTHTYRKGQASNDEMFWVAFEDVLGGIRGNMDMARRRRKKAVKVTSSLSNMEYTQNACWNALPLPLHLHLHGGCLLCHAHLRDPTTNSDTKEKHLLLHLVGCGKLSLQFKRPYMVILNDKPPHFPFLSFLEYKHTCAMTTTTNTPLHHFVQLLLIAFIAISYITSFELLVVLCVLAGMPKECCGVCCWAFKPTTRGKDILCSRFVIESIVVA